MCRLPPFVDVRRRVSPARGLQSMIMPGLRAVCILVRCVDFGSCSFCVVFVMMRTVNIDDLLDLHR